MPAHDVEVTGSFAINTYRVELTVGEGGTVTFSAIVGIEGITSETTHTMMYNLSGCKVQNTRQGEVLIQNGKKFIVK